MKFNIGNKYYFAGKSKSTGMYVIKEQKKTGYKDVCSCDSIEGIKAEIKHLKELGAKRESRQMVADICGTSYACAMRDMGN